MSYDDVWEDPASHFKAELTVRMMDALQGKKRVLDLGSGDGRNAIVLAAQGHEVTALERSATGIRRTEIDAKRWGLAVKTICKDFHKGLTGRYDAVIALQSLNHGTKDQVFALIGAVANVLTTNGIFIVKTADFDSYRLEHERGKVYKDLDFNARFEFIDERTYVPLDGEEEGIVHYAFLQEELREILEDAGFAITHEEKMRWHLLAIGRKS